MHDELVLRMLMSWERDMGAEVTQAVIEGVEGMSAIAENGPDLFDFDF